MRIAVDIFGGDLAPEPILNGCFQALPLLSEQDRLVLLGDKETLQEALAETEHSKDPRIEIFHCDDVIDMGASPIDALREQPNSTIAKMGWIGSAKAGDARCDMVISAGNTGACVAAAQMNMRRLPGVQRPGICTPMPTPTGPVMVCDVGANPDPRPQHLFQYAHMAALWAEKIHKIDKPRVGILSIGSEEGKGNQLVRDTHELLKQSKSDNFNYIGNIEGRDIFNNGADVVITEGFTGNVVLKLSEGLSKSLFTLIAEEAFDISPELALSLQPLVERIYKRYDYHELGGAPLLGVNGNCMICHGSSKAATVYNSIRKAIDIVHSDMNGAIVERMKEIKNTLAQTPHG